MTKALDKSYLTRGQIPFLKMTPWSLGKSIFYEAHLTKVPKLDELKTGSLSKPDEFG